MKVTKVTYHYEDGSIKEFVKEKPAWDEMWNIEWVKGAKQTKKERDAETKALYERLEKVDPAIFPEKLFE